MYWEHVCIYLYIMVENLQAKITKMSAQFNKGCIPQTRVTQGSMMNVFPELRWRTDCDCRIKAKGS